MIKELTHIPDAWQKAWRFGTFRNHLLISLLVFCASCLCNFHYLVVWQSRPGILINDIVLSHLQPHNFSAYIFFLEYSTLLMVFIFILPYPDRLVRGLQMFAIILFARTTTIYFMPLDPPRDMVPLIDPVANFFLHTHDVFVTKDLFFSGHVSALTLFFLIATNKYLRAYALIATLTVGTLIVWQHVHYSLDVLFAPLASYAAFKVVEWGHTQTKYGLELQDA